MSETNEKTIQSTMTVKEAFEKAYGPLPEGATCHIGYVVIYEGGAIGPTCATDSETTIYTMEKLKDDSFSWIKAGWADFVEGPDISNRPAEAFLKFFGEEYDKAVQE